MKPKRIEYIDVAKFLAMILVVFTHGVKESNFVAFAFAFHLPVFFVLNGMTLKVENQKFGDFLTKKLQRYIIPMFGLGIICVLFDLFIKWLFNNPIADHFILIGIANVINQIRLFAIWFLPALFFTDIILFGFHRLAKGRLWLMGVLSLLLLGIGIIFNQFHNVALIWNFDAALFGTIFTYMGFAFHHPKLSGVYTFLTKVRWRAILIGIALMVATYFISQYSYEDSRRHLEMFSRYYLPYYLTLPNAVMGSLGFILICRGITNPILAKPVEMNLALLAFHQVLAFPLFRFKVCPEWWAKVYLLPVSDLQYILFNATMTLFSIALVTVIYFIIKYSPFSGIVNQPLAGIYRRKTRDERRQPYKASDATNEVGLGRAERLGQERSECPKTRVVVSK